MDKPVEQEYTGLKEFYHDGWNEALYDYDAWILERLKGILDKIPARDGQKKNLGVLLDNWKESIALIEGVVKEIEGEG